MGTMIVLQGTSNSGKTTTLRKLAVDVGKKYSVTSEEVIEGNLIDHDLL